MATTARLYPYLEVNWTKTDNNLEWPYVLRKYNVHEQALQVWLL